MALLFLEEGFPFLPIPGLVSQEVLAHDQDPVRDGYRGPFRSSSFGTAAIVLSQITVFLVRRCMSSLNYEAS